METILKIKEDSWGKSYESKDGYIITTDKQTIKIGISNSQN
jgi:hypothetical protein